MVIVNEITMNIVKNAEDGESIYSLASRMGFAYSAVYKWISELERYGVISLIRKGNKNVIKINKNLIYKKFKELDDAVSVIEKDSNFWELVKTLRLRIRSNVCLNFLFVVSCLTFFRVSKSACFSINPSYRDSKRDKSWKCAVFIKVVFLIDQGAA